MTQASNHTPGPWQRGERTNLETDAAVGGVEGGGFILCTVWKDGAIGEQTAHANARRIVACVNACEGISDAELTRIMPETAKWIKDAENHEAERAALRERNQKLVEALRELHFIDERKLTATEKRPYAIGVSTIRERVERNCALLRELGE